MISNWGPLYDVCVIIGREDDTPEYHGCFALFHH